MSTPSVHQPADVHMSHAHEHVYHEHVRGIACRMSFFKQRLVDGCEWLACQFSACHFVQAVPLQGPGLHKNAFARVDSSKFVKALEVTDETATMYAYGPAHPKRWECAYVSTSSVLLNLIAAGASART